MMDLLGLFPPHNPSIYMRCGLGLPIARRAVDELIEFIGETEVLKLLMKGMVELRVVLSLKYKGSGSFHVVARRAIDEIVEFSGETKTPKYMKGARSSLSHVNAMIVEMEAMNDPDEYLDSLMCLRDSRRMGNDKLLLLNESIVGVEEEISTLEAHLEIIDAAINSE
ncbi:hypothetical protein Tco_0204066 [Tanacetum coccineum]